MDNQRMTTGRMAKVESRRRNRRVFIGVGTVLIVIVAIVGTLAILYINGILKKPGPKDEESKEGSTVTESVESETESEDPIDPALYEATIEKPRLLLVNSTRVPQRFGNAVTALDEYNEENGGIFEISDDRPEIRYGSETVILYQSGYDTYASEIGRVIGEDYPRKQIDVTVICGQDYSELIVGALVKKGELDEEVRVEVLNGCGVEGAGRKTQEVLENNGYTVVSLGNADTFDYKKSIILAPDTEKEDADRLSELFGMTGKTVKKPDYDIKIIVGDDY